MLQASLVAAAALGSSGWLVGPFEPDNLHRKCVGLGLLERSAVELGARTLGAIQEPVMKRLSVTLEPETRKSGATLEPALGDSAEELVPTMRWGPNELEPVLLVGGPAPTASWVATGQPPACGFVSMDLALGSPRWLCCLPELWEVGEGHEVSLCCEASRLLLGAQAQEQKEGVACRRVESVPVGWLLPEG